MNAPVAFCPQARPGVLGVGMPTVPGLQRGLRQSSRPAAAVISRAIAGDVQSPADQELHKTSPMETARICVFSAKKYVLDSFKQPVLAAFPRAQFVEHRLNKDTARLAEGCSAVVVFVNDDCSAEVVDVLAEQGVRMIALRCAGFDRVDLERCAHHGIQVARVPTYSPESVAEHAVTLVLALCRNLVQAHMRVRSGNFALSGLTGMEVGNKTAGVVGTGAIGACFAKIMLGFGCRVVAYDVKPNPELEALGVTYHPLDEVLGQADILSLHVPLLPATRNLLGRENISKLKRGVVVVNVSRGGLVDTDALIEALVDGTVGAAGLDVYEQEESLFFQDLSTESIRQRMTHWDRRFAELTSFPNVIVTPHAAFLTREALGNIAETTCANLREFVLGEPLSYEVKPRK